MQSKKLSVISSVVLVGFLCSFLLVVTNPVYAYTKQNSDIEFRAQLDTYGLFGSSTSSNEIIGTIPCGDTDISVSKTIAKGNGYHIYFSTNFFEPVDHERTIVIAIGLRGGNVNSGGSSESERGIEYYTSTLTTQTTDTGCRYRYRITNDFSASLGRYACFTITIPANARCIRCILPYSFSANAETDVRTHVLGSYLVDSADDDLINLVTQIYNELIDQGATLDGISDLMSVISDKVTTIDSNVLSIYQLLHDSLAEESAEVDAKTEQVAESIMQQSDGEQYWQDKNQENFDALSLDGFTFDGNIINGLGKVGTLFSSVWDAIGDYQIVFMFPLILGISLVIIGRVSRSGGKGKKGGDD